MTADATRPCRSIAVGILTVAALAGAPAAAHAQDADSAIPHRPDVTVEEYIEYVVKDLDTTWSKVFAEWGYAEPVVGVTTLSKGQSFTSACHDPGKRRVPVTDTTENAFYCPIDEIVLDGKKYAGNLILPVTSFQKMWQGNVFGRRSEVPGDFAAAVVVAHEFGHHIEDEMAIQSRSPHPKGKNKELIADCYAGVWMNSAYYRGILTDTDPDEAKATMIAIGDTGVSSDPHGSPAERSAALMTGYNEGTAQACITDYWK